MFRQLWSTLGNLIITDSGGNWQIKKVVTLILLLLLLLLLYDMDVSCNRPFLPGMSLEPAVIPTGQASSFTLQYFPYYV